MAVHPRTEREPLVPALGLRRGRSAGAGGVTSWPLVGRGVLRCGSCLVGRGAGRGPGWYLRAMRARAAHAPAELHGSCSRWARVYITRPVSGFPSVGQ